MPSKLHPLWYSQLLPLFFYISAIGAGIGMVILESYMSQRAFGHHLEMDLLEPLARAMVVALGIYGLMRLQAISRNGAFSAITDFTYEGRMFRVEFVLGVLLPVAMLSFRRLRTRIGTRLILGAGLVTAVVIGLMTASIVRTHTAQLVSERTRSANQLSEAIKSSTHFDMASFEQQFLEPAAKA